MLVKRLVKGLWEFRATEQLAQTSLCFVFDTVLPNGCLESLTAFQPRVAVKQREERKGGGRLGRLCSMCYSTCGKGDRGVREELCSDVEPNEKVPRGKGFVERLGIL